jgi:hypothetical protein
VRRAAALSEIQEFREKPGPIRAVLALGGARLLSFRSDGSDAAHGHFRKRRRFVRSALVWPVERSTARISCVFVIAEAPAGNGGQRHCEPGSARQSSPLHSEIQEFREKRPEFGSYWAFEKRAS